MSNLGNFDPTTVDPNQVAPFPDNNYCLQVIESEVKATKNGNGTMLNLTLEVIDGEYKGRRVYERINIQNASAAAQQIGQKQLSGLCHACGHLKAVTDSNELHYKPFWATIGIEKDDSGKYAPKNVVKKYLFENGNAPAGAVPATPAIPAQPATLARPAPQAMPWGQR